MKRTAEADGEADGAKKARVALSAAYQLNALGGGGGGVRVCDILSGDATGALLTTFELELDWLLAVAPVLRQGIPATLVHGQRAAVRVPGSLVGSLTIRAARMPLPYGVHHAKLFLVYLRGGSAVRVAVSTANLIQLDWEHKTQGVWSQDFPRKQQQQQPAQPPTAFEDTLADYVGRVAGGVAAARVREFDFSSATAALLLSVPGLHKGADVWRYGHLQLRQLLRSASLPPRFEDAPVVCQFSSFGSTSERWLAEFFTSFAMSATRQRERTVGEALRGLRLVWPTTEFVRNSIDGWGSGGSLCCPQRNIKDFLRPLLRHYLPPAGCGRDAIPPHIKTFTRIADPEDDSSCGGELPWLILTSANFSQAAWGALQKTGKQYVIRNYELGVLLLPQQEARDAAEAAAAAAADPIAPRCFIAVDQLPQGHQCAGHNAELAVLPYGLPLRRYGSSDVPWTWDVTHEEADVLGQAWRPPSAKS